VKGQVVAIYQYIRHPRIAERHADRPVKVADFAPSFDDEAAVVPSPHN